MSGTIARVGLIALTLAAASGCGSDDGGGDSGTGGSSTGGSGGSSTGGSGGSGTGGSAGSGTGGSAGSGTGGSGGSSTGGSGGSGTGGSGGSSTGGSGGSGTGGSGGGGTISPPTGCAYPAAFGSCLEKSGIACKGYTGSSYQAVMSQQKSACESVVKGTWKSDGTCPVTNVVGICWYGCGSTSAYFEFGYTSGGTAAQLKSACTNMSGVWTAL
jgi:hypothetical protein